MQTILISGATSGIGRCAALYLASRGHHVIASGRKAEALAELAAEATARGHRLDAVRLDVTDQASIDAACAEAQRLTEGRGIDALINNAGYGHAGPTAETTGEQIRRQFETNVFGLMALTRAFLPQIRARRGRILNVSSIGGRVTFPFFGVYNASKYAVESLSDALRVELAAFGVRVVLIEPGPIRSQFSDTAVSAVKKFGDPASPYAALFERADALKEMADKQSADPIVVARAMERALTARRPKARYVAPWSSKLLLSALKLMPVALSDAIMRRLTGLTRAGLRLPAEKRCMSRMLPGRA